MNNTIAKDYTVETFCIHSRHFVFKFEKREVQNVSENNQ